MHSPDASGQRRARVGAYYFDGWAGPLTSYHFAGMVDGAYRKRQPLSGWQDDTSCAMTRQLAWARNYGINFFVFLWYYNAETNTHGRAPYLNTALRNYRALADHLGVGYTLLFVNDSEFSVPPSAWPEVVEEWSTYFADPDYVRVDGKPLFMLIDAYQLRRSFGTGTGRALDALRDAARTRGLPGAYVVGGVGPPHGSSRNDPLFPDLSAIATDGYDALSLYSYPYTPQVIAGERPYAELADAAQWIWDGAARTSTLPYVPVVMAGWDPRPWDVREPTTNALTWYRRSPEEFAQLVRAAIAWSEANPGLRSEPAPAPPLVMIEAWNELGEGSYIVPTLGEGHRYGDALAKALLEAPSRTSTLTLDAGQRISVEPREAAGRLIDSNGQPLAGALIELSARPLDGPGQYAEYTVSGIVPPDATEAVLGLRVNNEGGGPGWCDLSLYEVRYRETGNGAARVAGGDFTSGAAGWTMQGSGALAVNDRGGGLMLRVTAGPSQDTKLDSSRFAVTAGATYQATFSARVAPSSLGSGHFVLIFVSQSEVQRIALPLGGATTRLGQTTTDRDGNYRFDLGALAPYRLRLHATYAGDGSHAPASASVTR